MVRPARQLSSCGTSWELLKVVSFTVSPKSFMLLFSVALRSKPYALREAYSEEYSLGKVTQGSACLFTTLEPGLAEV